MGQQWPKSGGFEFNTSGTLQTGCLAYFYEAGTSTPLTTYEDGDETTPHEHPVEMSGNRWPLIFVPFGTYKYVIKTSGGTTLFTADDVPNPEPEDPAIGVDANAILQTGDIIIAGKNGTRAGFVRCNGRTIGNAASGATERANADTSTLFAYLWDNYANGQAAVSGGRGASASADYSANKTIALPDLRGAALVGFDDMGNSAASLLGSAPVVTGSTILAGSVLGANTHTITTSHMPSHTHALTAATAASNGAHTHTGSTSSDGAHTHTINITDPGHNHSIAISGQFTGTSGGTTLFASGGSSNTNSNTTGITAASVSNGAHTHTISSDGAHTHTLSGTTDSSGSGTAHNILSRSGLVTFLMKL